MKKRYLLIFVLMFFCFGIECLKVSLTSYFNLPEEFYVNFNEIEDANTNNIFGKNIKLALQEKQVNAGEQTEQYVIVKLFGFIPIKKIKAKILPEEEVFVGGEIIGLSATCDGTIVVSNNTIDEGSGEIFKNTYFKNGDIIYKINDLSIESVTDIQTALKKSDSEAKIEILRDNKKVEQIVPLIKDKNGAYKLGIWGKNGISGVGTLTFVKQNGDFGALGHAITSGTDENIIPIKQGKVYSCNLVGIKKGEHNSPGELRCVFVPKNEKGDISKNTKQGIYGNLTNFGDLIDNNLTLSLGGRLSVKTGEAKIISCVSGIREEYKIEIIKANYQNSTDEKSIVFRVTDPKLLNITGGIVQGMSGSPIIQNGKIVGAVTHVFLSDPTKGYGVYTDWMLEQMDSIKN